jgi:hypothetical protein
VRRRRSRCGLSCRGGCSCRLLEGSSTSNTEQVLAQSRLLARRRRPRNRHQHLPRWPAGSWPVSGAAFGRRRFPWWWSAIPRCGCWRWFWGSTATGGSPSPFTRRWHGLVLRKSAPFLAHENGSIGGAGRGTERGCRRGLKGLKGLKKRCSASRAVGVRSSVASSLVSHHHSLHPVDFPPHWRKMSLIPQLDIAMANPPPRKCGAA